MKRIEPNAQGVSRYKSEMLQLPHAMFTRRGGTSSQPFASLNLSHGVGDDPASVTDNRQRIKQLLTVDHLISARQIHSNKICVINHIPPTEEQDGFDALMTNLPGTGLMIQQADCQAVLLHDPVKKAVAAIHNGWRGSAGNIIGSTIKQMRQTYTTEPGDLIAAISPSLGPCCSQFINHARELPPDFLPFQVTPNHFDFWAISKKQLQEAGVLEANIDIAGICTACNRDFFSYRRSKKEGDGITGRNGSVIALSGVL